MHSTDDEKEASVILPIEIWENVLFNLYYHSPKTFLIAAKVCVQWRHLAIRLCKKLFLSKLHENLIDELYEIQVTHQRCSRKNRVENEDCCDAANDEEWLKVLALYQETRLQEANEIFPVRIFESTSFHVEDPFLLLATYRTGEDETVKGTSISIYNALDFPLKENVDTTFGLQLDNNNKYSSLDIEEEIYNVHFLFLSSPVLLVRSKEFNYLRWVPLSQECCLTQSDLIVVTPTIDNTKLISTEGRFLLAVDDLIEGSHTLYKANFDNKDNRLQLAFECICTFRTGCPLFKSKLLRGHVKITLRSGHISLYKIPKFENQLKFYLEKQSSSHQSNFNTQNMECSSSDATFSVSKSVKLAASSTFSKDLRYPNQTIFSQDWTFTSTAISSELLYYWHMDRGREFSWLVGSTFMLHAQPNNDESFSAPSYYNLYNIIIGEEINSEVTAVQVTRGMLLCGTSHGHVLIYKLQEEAEMNEYNLDFLKKAPWMTLPLIDRKIVVISGLWTPLGLLIIVLDAKKYTTISFLPLSE